jgi:hypothetical protein
MGDVKNSCSKNDTSATGGTAVLFWRNVEQSCCLCLLNISYRSNTLFKFVLSTAAIFETINLENMTVRRDENFNKFCSQC